MVKDLQLENEKLKAERSKWGISSDYVFCNPWFVLQRYNYSTTTLLATAT
jgi:hypothetical protein